MGNEVQLGIKFGRRKDDNQIITDIKDGRMAVVVDVRYAEGIPLEAITPRIDGALIAIALVNTKWGTKLRFMNRRPNWGIDDYFKHAEKLMAEQRSQGNPGA